MMRFNAFTYLRFDSAHAPVNLNMLSVLSALTFISKAFAYHLAIRCVFGILLMD